MCGSNQLVGLAPTHSSMNARAKISHIIGPPMAFACLVKVPWDEEELAWSPGAFIRNPISNPFRNPFSNSHWITRSQIRARARLVRFLVKLLSTLNEDVQAIIVSFFWDPYPNPWDSLH